MANYSLGEIHWHKLGNGVSARSCYQACIDDFEKHGYGQSPDLRTVHANSLEKAMLCALSFDEFEDLAGRLRAISPRAPILSGLLPEVRTGRERGESWTRRLFALAASNYNRTDPRRDAHHYGEAKSAYQLMLANRPSLRVTREDWRMAIYENSFLALQLTNDCIAARGGDDDRNSPDEFLPILTETIPMVDEYLRFNPGDEDLVKVRANMERIVINARRRWGGGGVQRPAESQQYQPKPTKGCAPVLAMLVAAATVIGVVLGRLVR